LLLGDGYIPLGYLDMGFLPAWLYTHVWELAFAEGRLTAAHDRSAELASVRERLGEAGLKPALGTPLGKWIDATLSLSFDYSWPRP
jgi:hypothetical protein